MKAIQSIALKVFGAAFVPEWHFYDGGSEERETCRAKSALKVFGEAFVPEWHFYDGGSEERKKCRAKSALKVFGAAFYKKLQKKKKHNKTR